MCFQCVTSTHSGGCVGNLKYGAIGAQRPARSAEKTAVMETTLKDASTVLPFVIVLNDTGEVIGSGRSRKA